MGSMLIILLLTALWKYKIDGKKKEKNYNSSYKYYCSCGDGVIRYVVYEKG